MTEDTALSRQRVLQLSGTAATGLLAGYTGWLPFSSSKQTAIDNVSFQGNQVIVTLKDGTNADKIDLRSPNAVAIQIPPGQDVQVIDFVLLAELDELREAISVVL